MLQLSAGQFELRVIDADDVEHIEHVTDAETLRTSAPLARSASRRSHRAFIRESRAAKSAVSLPVVAIAAHYDARGAGRLYERAHRWL